MVQGGGGALNFVQVCGALSGSRLLVITSFAIMLTVVLNKSLCKTRNRSDESKPCKEVDCSEPCISALRLVRIVVLMLEECVTIWRALYSSARHLNFYAFFVINV